MKGLAVSCKGEDKHVYAGSTGFSQNRAAGGSGGAGGENVIDENDVLAQKVRRLAFRNGEGPAYIATTLTAVETSLRSGVTMASEQVRPIDTRRFARQKTGDLGRLIVTPPQKPPWMKRDRDDEALLCDQRSTCAKEATGHEVGRIMPVVKFQSTHQKTGGAFIGNSGAQCSPWRIMHNCSRCFQLFSFVREWTASDRAGRRFDEMQLRPAVGAKIVCPRNGRTAGETRGWKKRINTGGGECFGARPCLWSRQRKFDHSTFTIARAWMSFSASSGPIQLHPLQCGLVAQGIARAEEGRCLDFHRRKLSLSSLRSR